MAEEDAEQGEEQAQFGGRILEHDGEQAGVLGLLDEGERADVAARLVEGLERHAQARALDEHGCDDDDVVDRGVAEHGVGADLANAGNAFVHGKAAAQGEDHHGHHERPEVELVPVAEGVLQVGLA